MEMHHASKTILKLFTPFHPRQLSCEHTYARSHPAEGAGARSSAGFPGPRTLLASLAPGNPRAASPQQWMMGRCFPPHACTAGRAVPICKEGMWRGSGRRETAPSSPSSTMASKVLQLQNNRSASAETFLRSSLCPRFSNGMWGQGHLQHWEGTESVAG